MVGGAETSGDGVRGAVAMEGNEPDMAELSAVEVTHHVGLDLLIWYTAKPDISRNVNDRETQTMGDVYIF